MLQSTLIGHLGADAECKNANGKEFVTFRVANTDRWTDDAGQVHESTTWVDCVINGKPKVFDYLKKGQMIYVTGSVSLRVYSSAVEKCMKAGLTINVQRIELLGGKTDDIPAKLYTESEGKEVIVMKYYFAPQLQREVAGPETVVLVSKRGEKYNVDRQGWVSKEKPAEG